MSYSAAIRNFVRKHGEITLITNAQFYPFPVGLSGSLTLDEQGIGGSMGLGAGGGYGAALAIGERFGSQTRGLAINFSAVGTPAPTIPIAGYTVGKLSIDGHTSINAGIGYGLGIGLNIGVSYSSEIYKWGN